MRQMRHQQKEKPVRKACLMTCSRFPDKGQRRNRYAHGKSPELYRDVPYTNGIASWPIDTRTVATASPWIRYFLCSSVLVGVLLVCNLNHPGKRDASYECCVSIGVLSAFSCPSQVLVAINYGNVWSRTVWSESGVWGRVFPAGFYGGHYHGHDAFQGLRTRYLWGRQCTRNVTKINAAS